NGFYVFVYTVWLKRRTSQNIVIGGAAGAFPPMIGWAAVTGGLSLEPLLLFLIIFAWTPPHFWALALYRATDYAKAGIPMLPVASGIRHTQAQILLYTGIMAAAAMAPVVIGMTGWIYGISAGVLNLLFLICSWRLYRSDESELEKPAKQTFGFSILYLFALFAALIVDRAPTVGAIW
ncbi:MAG: heme o synthase, partial [Cytophagales bacterium]|nr:heme o synthase [Cytophagales bacterium]